MALKKEWGRLSRFLSVTAKKAKENVTVKVRKIACNSKTKTMANIQIIRFCRPLVALRSPYNYFLIRNLRQ